MSHFRVEHLSFHYSKTDEVILKDVSLTLEQGQFTALIGPNGAGKTTLMRLLLGYLEPTSGDIYYGPDKIRDIDQKTFARTVAYLPQASQGALYFPVRDVILMGRYPWKGRWEGYNHKDKNAFDRAVELTGLQKFLDRPFDRLSGGERQRVLLARALCQDTPWLFLDEASNNLDLSYQVALFDLLRKLQEQGEISILAILHDINLAAKYASESLLLRGHTVEHRKEDPFSPEVLSELLGLRLIELKDAAGERHIVWTRGTTSQGVR